MNWQVIVFETLMGCFRENFTWWDKVLPVKAHVLSQENEHVNITHVPQTFVGVLFSAEPTDYFRHIQVFLCFGPFLHLMKTKVFPHFWPGVSRIATDLQLVHFSRHVGLVSNMLARHVWEDTGNWGEIGESEGKTNNCSSWIRGDIIFLWWFSCTYIWVLFQNLF